MALGAIDRTAGDVAALAPQGLSAVLAVEEQGRAGEAVVFSSNGRVLPAQKVVFQSRVALVSVLRHHLPFKTCGFVLGGPSNTGGDDAA